MAGKRGWPWNLGTLEPKPEDTRPDIFADERAANIKKWRERDEAEEEEKKKIQQAKAEQLAAEQASRTALEKEIWKKAIAEHDRKLEKKAEREAARAKREAARRAAENAKRRKARSKYLAEADRRVAIMQAKNEKQQVKSKRIKTLIVAIGDRSFSKMIAASPRSSGKIDLSPFQEGS